MRFLLPALCLLTHCQPTRLFDDYRAGYLSIEGDEQVSVFQLTDDGGLHWARARAPRWELEPIATTSEPAAQTAEGLTGFPLDSQRGRAYTAKKSDTALVFASPTTGFIMSAEATSALRLPARTYDASAVFAAGEWQLVTMTDDGSKEAPLQVHVLVQRGDGWEERASHTLVNRSETGGLLHVQVVADGQDRLRFLVRNSTVDPTFHTTLLTLTTSNAWLETNLATLLPNEHGSERDGGLFAQTDGTVRFYMDLTADDTRARSIFRATSNGDDWSIVELPLPPGMERSLSYFGFRAPGAFYQDDRYFVDDGDAFNERTVAFAPATGFGTVPYGTRMEQTGDDVELFVEAAAESFSLGRIGRRLAKSR